MRSTLALLFGRSDQPIGRATYLKAGVSLMLLKYAVDAALIGIFAGVTWTPVDYLLPMISFNAEKIAGFPQALNIALLVWMLPFIWIGVTLSVRRAIDARIFPGVVVTFFVPFFNYILMAVLALAPSRVREPLKDPAPMPDAEPPLPIGHGGLVAVLAGALTGLVAAGAGVVLLRTYGGSIFLGTPFLIGLVSAFVANRIEPKTRSETIGIGQLALLATGGTLMLLSIEGIPVPHDGAATGLAADDPGIVHRPSALAASAAALVLASHDAVLPAVSRHRHRRGDPGAGRARRNDSD